MCSFLHRDLPRLDCRPHGPAQVRQDQANQAAITGKRDPGWTHPVGPALTSSSCGPLSVPGWLRPCSAGAQVWGADEDSGGSQTFV